MSPNSEDENQENAIAKQQVFEIIIIPICPKCTYEFLHGLRFLCGILYCLLLLACVFTKLPTFWSCSLYGLSDENRFMWGIFFRNRLQRIKMTAWPLNYSFLEQRTSMFVFS